MNDMDHESWLKGYLAGVSLRNHMRVSRMPSCVIATMSVTGIAADFDWFADLSGVESLTHLSAEYAGDVTARYSYDGQTYTDPAPIAELLNVNAALLFDGVDPETPRLWFRFHLDNDAADLTKFTLWGVPRKENANAVP